jgi:methenyltetrahydromethanopterin cyclohydrolase
MTQSTPSEPVLNELAWDLVEDTVAAAGDLGVAVHRLPSGGRVLDFGVEVPGSLAAGITLAEVCTAGLAEISVQQGAIADVGWPHVFIMTDEPVEACLYSQYAGWELRVGEFFGMGSGPMRAAARVEPLFERYGYQEQAENVVGVIESSRLPGDDVVAEVASRCGVDPQSVALLVAPTASLAGSLQVVARSIETALHKLVELRFDVARVRCATGSAPLAPVAADDLAGIGRTNDAILYGGRVSLWVTGDDDSIDEIGPRVPSRASLSYGQPFLSIFERAGHDFYKVDKLLFSPAEVTFQNVETGRVHVFGGVNPGVLQTSFGIPRRHH